MKKKLITTLLCTAIAIGLFSGCGSDSTDSNEPNKEETPEVSSEENNDKETEENTEKAIITIMEWDSGVDNAIKDFDVFFETFPEYKDKVEIEVVTGGSGPEDIMETMRKMMASGEQENMPDIITCNWAQVPEYYEMGIIRDVSEVYDEHGDEIIDGVVNLMKYKDQYMGFPAEVKCKIWAYRKDMFEEAGVDPNEVTTVEELIDAGKKIQEVYPESYIENYTEVANGYDLFAYFTGNDARLADDEGNYICASDPGVREAFEFYSTMRDSGVVSTTIQDFSEEWVAALNDGTICSQVLADWFATNHLPNYCPDMGGQWGYALWPDEIAKGSESGAKLMMVNNSSPEADLAVEMLTKFCYTEESAKALYKGPRGLIPYLKASYKDPEITAATDYWGEDRMQVLQEAMEILTVYPYTPNSTLEQSIIVQYLGEYLSGTKDLDAALQAAEDDMKAQIGNAYD
ncbi:MAG: extracellular solute-binding protein [Lachnospiraceae bacterium]|nr:extracellular solute-binding protein [Lachnospiraceae bacterium]